ALKVGQEIEAFADQSAISQPYLDALVRQKVVAFGGLHLPQSYYQERAPYAWGQLIDCTTLTNSAIDLIAKRLPPAGKAERAGSAAMREKQRQFGLIVPDDAVYAQCINEARPKLKAAGITIAKEIRYSLELAKLQQEAPNIAAQLKNAGITTVVLVTDPILPFFLSGSATQQNYWPEWFISGTVFTDVDVAGQFYDQDQWQFAYGQSYISDIAQGNASESYRAYKKIRPQDEPTLTRDLDYYSMLMLFIGLQMAGPDLNPATFQAGMFAYPGRVGPLGAWSWGPNDYTAIDDAREIYYDRRALSAFNNQPGRYIAVSGNRRYRGSWPARVAAAPIPPPAAP
ncbi:MAG: ABC transporter substrate-binding protein, partial [Sporichthyaceae bacterium]